MDLLQDFNKAIKNIRRQLQNYIRENKLNSLIIGLSGGIDSALVTALAAPVCCQLKIPLIGRCIPIETNKPNEIKRATMIGKYYTTHFENVDLTNIYTVVSEKIVEKPNNDDEKNINFRIRLGNIKARLRMIYLYELASKHKGLVLATDNLTELLLGFWTLHGDVGDYGMIQQLWKTEVYQMANYIAVNEADSNQKKALIDCVNAIPTDGLGITNSDLEQLQANSYAEVDKILISYLEKKNLNLEDNPIIIRYKNSKYKRNNPYNLRRETFFN